MSELKHQLMLNKDRSWVPCYIKSEADKVIADFKQKMKQQDVLLGKALNNISESNKHVISLAGKCNHANYKRCLTMADLCTARAAVSECVHWDDRKFIHYSKWHDRWLILADKIYKEANNV